ncbi:MAG: multicopper oxidase family protein [Steroidobacteraceae bacterium]
MSKYFFAWLSLLLGVFAGLAIAAEPPQSALEVDQPRGWDSELAMPQPVDLNPDPHILEIALEAKVVELELTPGRKSTVWTYNGLLPGPYIRAAKGDRLIVHFRNSLPDATTVHWHGVRLSNDMDGTPGLSQALVPPGGEFTYDFVLRDAGTYWYHPHADSAAQVGFGLYGAIVVTDPDDPESLGDDLVLLLSDISLDKNGQLMDKKEGGNFGDLFGREGSTLLINGRVMPTLQVRQGKPQRWRFINAARSRYWTFALRDNIFTRIGGDNGLAARSEKQARISIVPGERLDVVYTPTLSPGSSTHLRWLAYDRGYGTTVGRPPENVMAIRSVEESAVQPAAIPELLRKIVPIDISKAVQQTLELTIDLETRVEMGFNGKPFWQSKPLVARVGEKHVWTLVNNSAFDHPFHLHGYFFQVLDERRVPEWKDTINVPVKSKVRIAIDFDERPGFWMFHCHILDHAEVGMMGHLEVWPEKGILRRPTGLGEHHGMQHSPP